jgi:outer membrane murein-binding lipoprotein Lpp
MNTKKILIVSVVLVAILVFASNSHAQPITVAVDLGHGESNKYLNYIMGNITGVQWRIITTTITPDVLKGVDILLLGQPTVAFSPDEIQAIKDWLFSGNKVLYVAGDSDYGPGQKTIVQINDLLAGIGTKLRLEHGSVYSDNPDVTAQAYYRMLTYVKPDNIPGLFTDIINQGVTKPILMHGPGCVIWQDAQGKYHDPVKETFPGLIRIVWAHKSYIGDNTPPLPYVYDPMTYGKGTGDHDFVMYAAEYFSDKNSLVVVAGESLYGDYEPAWASSYYGVSLDGPLFVQNLIKWWVKLITTGPIERKLGDLSQSVSTLSGNLNQLSSQVSSQGSAIQKMQGDIQSIKNDVDSLKATVNSLAGTVNELMILVIVEAVLIVVVLALMFLRKPKATSATEVKK